MEHSSRMLMITAGSILKRLMVLPRMPAQDMSMVLVRTMIRVMVRDMIREQPVTVMITEATVRLCMAERVELQCRLPIPRP